MIKNAQVIAIVHISKVEPVEMRAAKWTYRQRAKATVDVLIKGELPWKETPLYGDENNFEARTHFAAGRFLVFLKQDTSWWRKHRDH